MSHLNPVQKQSYEEVSNNLPQATQKRRSVSLDSWILDDIQELYIDDSQSVGYDSEADFSLNAKSLEDSWILQKAYSHSPETCYQPNEVFLSDESPTFDKTNGNKSECEKGMLVNEYKVNRCDESSHPIKSLVPQQNTGNADKHLLKTSVTPTNRESNSFLGQLFSNKKFPGSLQRTKSTDSVHDPNSCLSEGSKSCRNKESFILKSYKQPCSSTRDQQPAQVKTKIRSIWNNMKYGWRVRREANLKVDRAIWLLGECYHNRSHDGTLLSHDVANLLKLDLLSKIFFTYRLNFPALPGTDIVTDSGWGCMLRAGQMMMAQALVCNFLHREWRIASEQPLAKKKLHRMILRWFGDTMSTDSPFSLHHLVTFGEHYGRKAGDWYGPTHVAHVLRDALKFAKSTHPKLSKLCMYVASDGIVFKQDVFDLCLGSSNSTVNSKEELLSEKISCKTNPVSSHLSFQFSQEKNVTSCSNWEENELGCIVYSEPKLKNSDDCENMILRTRHVSQCKEADDTETSFLDSCPSYSEYGPPSFNAVHEDWESLILFVSVRLGNDKINPFYIPCLKSLLAYENCIGIIGGRPKHALYFIGWQDEKLIHMDPHSCQPAIDMEKEDFCIKSFHSSSVRTMLFSEMDPSCAIGFYFRRKEDFEIFIEKFDEITSPRKKNLDYPIFALAEGKRAEIESMNAHLSQNHSFIQSYSSDLHNEDDDYILL